MSNWQNIIKDDTGKVVYRRRLASIKEGKSPFEALEGLLGDYETDELYDLEKEIMKDMAELKKKVIKAIEERIKDDDDESGSENTYDSEDAMMRERERQGGYGGWNDAY